MAETATEGQYTEAAPVAPFRDLTPPESPVARVASPNAAMLLPSIADRMANQERVAAQGIDRMRAPRQAVREAGLARDDVMKQLPPLPTLTEPPSRGLRAFLAPGDNESPMTSIAKLMQATALFIGQTSGAVRGDAIGALAAWNGALQGWASGDAERADRAYKDWEAKDQKARETYKLQRQRWEDILMASDKSLEQKRAELEIVAAETKDEQALAALQTGDVLAYYGLLDARDKHADQMQINRDKITAMADKAREDRQFRADMQRDRQEFQAQMARERREDKRAADEQRRAELDAVWSGAPLRAAAIDYATTGKLPAGLNRSGSGAFIIPKLINDAIAWAKENGKSPEDFPVLRAEIASAKSALTKQRSANAIQEGSIRRLDGHLDKLVELSAKVPRGNHPIANEYILKGRKDWSGDVDTANYILQGLEVGMELAKAFVGTAQGDAATREEGRHVFAAGSTHDMVVGAVKTLRENVHRNLEINKESERATAGIIESAMGKPGKAATGKIRVKRKSDGVSGTIDEKDFDAAKYERI